MKSRSRFFEPPSETKIGFKSWVVREFEGLKITAFD